MRSHPQMSKMYMVIQQPERLTDAPYLAQQEWMDYDWSCRVNGDVTGEIIGEITVDTGGAAIDLLDGMTVLIGSERYGDWDRGVVRLRTDQTVGPGTTTLYIATSSDLRGRVFDGDYIVVLDEFRTWQRFGQIDADGAGNITWYKDHDIEWDDLGADDAARRLASMPPCPVMGPHAVKFVDPTVGDGHSAQFYFDWSNSYAMAPGEAITTWTSSGEINHTGGTWNSAAETPGWQEVDFISGLRGFRVTLAVDDGNGNATTLPYRRGIRYVFTLRRPGQTQEYDPPNSEPITEFSVDPIQGSFDSGYWKTTVTVYGEQASKYIIQPEALVILFTDSYYMANSPYFDPYQLINVNVGSIYDRENILLIGRVDGSSINVDSETGTTTFDILSPGAEVSMYHDYPIPIQDNTDATDWINTPSLTPDRALWHYLCWHTTLPHTADLYLPGDTHPLWAMDFLEGTIYDVADSFLSSRILGRMLGDKYGRVHCEYIAQYQPYGSTPTLFVLDDGDWADTLDVKQSMRSKAKSVDAGGLIHVPGVETPVPKLSRAPGQFDKYRGTESASNYLAINTQWELNMIAGRYLEGLNYVYDVNINFAGFWSYLDIAPQRAIYIHKELDRDTIDGRFLPQTVTFTYDPAAGYISTSAETVQEMNDGVPGVTIPIPEELPDLEPPVIGLSAAPVFPSDFTAPAVLGCLPGEACAGDAIAVGRNFHSIPYTTDWISSPPSWSYTANATTHVSVLNLMYRSGVNANRLFTGAWSAAQNEWTGADPIIQEYTPLPLGSGAWVDKITALQIATELGHDSDYYGVMISDMISGLREDQEQWGWAVGICYYNGGGGYSDRYALYFCAHTRDAWSTLYSCTEIMTSSYGGSLIHQQQNTQFEIAQDLHTGYLFVAIAEYQPPITNIMYLTLYRSATNGASWIEAHQDTTWDFWSSGRVGTYHSITSVFIPYGHSWSSGGTVFWSGCVSMWDTDFVPNRQYPGRVYKSTANGASPVRLDSDGSAVADNDPVTAPTKIIGPYNGAGYLFSISVVESMRTSFGWDPSIFKWTSGSGWSTWGSVAKDPGTTAIVAGYVRQTSPDVTTVQVPTAIGWMVDPYETTAGGDDDKGNLAVYGSIIPVET
jgi:hypothetical protein